MSLHGRLTKAITSYDNPRSLSSRLRTKRIAPLLEMIETVYEQYGSVSIIDVGGAEKYWDIVPSSFLDAHNVTITLANLPGEYAPGSHGHFTIVEADGCSLELYEDCSFDIAHSNSVVEHVGGWEEMVAFAGEIARVAPMYHVQTPYYWFPIEPHSMTPLLHWLPKTVQAWLIRHLQLGHWRRAETKEEARATVESARLLSRRAFQALFPAADIVTERFLGLPKSLVALKRQ